MTALFCNARYHSAGVPSNAHYVGVALWQAMGGVLFTDLLDFDADLNDAGRSPFGSIAAHEWCRAEVRRPPTSHVRSLID